MILRLASKNKFCLQVSETKSKLVLTLNTRFGENTYKIYEGTYDINPKITMQELETKDKVMLDNVTVNEIYYNETENESGGMTAQIGEI